MEKTQFYRWANGQSKISDQMTTLVKQCYHAKKVTPRVIVVILPEGAHDIYTAVKQCVILSLSHLRNPFSFNPSFGDVSVSIPIYQIHRNTQIIMKARNPDTVSKWYQMPPPLAPILLEH